MKSELLTQEEIDMLLGHVKPDVSTGEFSGVEYPVTDQQIPKRDLKPAYTVIVTVNGTTTEIPAYEGMLVVKILDSSGAVIDEWWHF